MIYLGIGLIAISCFVLGYKLGTYSEKLYLALMFGKIIEDICEKYKLDTKDVIQVISVSRSKFKTGEYSVTTLFKRFFGR